MSFQRAKEIVAAAIKLALEDRGAYLDEHCGDDQQLRDNVETLLMYRLDAPTVKDQTEPRIVGDYQHGDTVAHFTIRDRLGSGGMGAVYLAEQSVPVKRQVALKVIKPGFDTRNTLARFQAEQQALAMMDHPCIARVLEAGATDTGRPWFAMEYIKGDDLNTYCDENKLDTTQRLELFIKICEAIQHAHQKGIMHRDLKPGNILVARDENDEPQPKVIDFGIAKAVSASLTDMTLHTVIGQLVGTLPYMSPEQVKGSDDIDTRTDVYSLGVMLYELICGRVPFASEMTSDSGQEAMKHSIREVDPPRPSTQFSSIDQAKASAIARARRTDTGSLQSTLRRELEWIPLKALRKDRRERYASPEALAADVQRYLDGEALEAGPITRAYRFKKYLGRNKVPVITAAAFVLLLIAATVVSLVLWQQAQQQAARAEAVKDFVTTMLSSVDPETAGSMDKELMKLVLSHASASVGEQFEDQPLVEAEIRSLIGSTYMSLGQLDEAEPHLVEALAIRRSVLDDEHPDTLISMGEMGDLLNNQGKYDEAMPYYTEALEKRRHVLGNDHPNTIASIGKLGTLFYRLNKWEEAMPYYEQALEGHRRVQGDEHPNTLASIGNMGLLLDKLGRREEAMPYYAQALEGKRRILGDEHPQTLGSIGNMGVLLAQQNKFTEAMPYFREVLEIQRRVHGDEHSDTLAAISNMGKLLVILGKSKEAMVYLREGLETSRRVLGDEHPDTLRLITNMGDLLYRDGKYDEAMVYVIEAFESQRRVHGDENPDTLLSMHNVGIMLMAQEKSEEAMPYLREALEKRRQLLGDQSEDTLFSINAMGDLLSRQGQYEEAMPYLREALETRREVLGDTHPDTISSMGDMGDLLLNQERYDEAMPYIQEALETSRSVWGEDNPQTLSAMGRMGNLLYKQGKYTEAMVYLREALEKRRSHMGDEHPNTLWTINALSELHDAWHEAEPDAGHDATAAEYRQLLEEIQANANAEPATP